MQFHRLQFSPPPEWPAVSVIVPACNEAANIESAVATLIRQDYPNFELILVDDRSTDGTGTIIDRFAASDQRIHALHVQVLPDGWLGKVHALERAVEAAKGDWLLFTDADVHFNAATLRRAVGFAVDRQLDHLALAPLALQASFLLDIVVHTFMLLFPHWHPRRRSQPARQPRLCRGRRFQSHTPRGIPAHAGFFLAASRTLR